MGHADDAKKEIERAQAKLVEAERQLKVVKEVVALLPTGIEPKRIGTSYGYRCDGVVHFDIERHADAVPLLAALPPVSATYMKGACTSIIPTERVKPGEEDDGMRAVYEVAGFHLVLEMGIGYTQGTEEKVEWWTRLGPYLLNVDAKCKVPAWRIQAINEHYSGVKRHGATYIPKWVLPEINLPGRNVISWAADPPSFSSSGSPQSGSKRLTVYFDAGTSADVLATHKED